MLAVGEEGCECRERIGKYNARRQETALEVGFSARYGEPRRRLRGWQWGAGDHSIGSARFAWPSIKVQGQRRQGASSVVR